MEFVCLKTDVFYCYFHFLSYAVSLHNSEWDFQLFRMEFGNAVYDISNGVRQNNNHIDSDLPICQQ